MHEDYFVPRCLCPRHIHVRSL